MKSALLVLSLFLTSAAFAQVPELKPIRQANAHFVVTKLTTSPAPGGAQTAVEIVCVKDVSIPVFDARPVSGGYSYSTANTACPTTSSGQPMDVELNGWILLSSDLSPGASFDTKSFNASVWVENPNNRLPISASSSAWSRDLGLKSIGLTLAPESLVVCQSPPTQSPPTPSNPPVPNPPSMLMKVQGPGTPPQPADPTQCTHAYGDYISATVEITD